MWLSSGVLLMRAERLTYTPVDRLVSLWISFISTLFLLPLSQKKADTFKTRLSMSNPIVDAVQKHPAPEGLKYTYGTAGVSGCD